MPTWLAPVLKAVIPHTGSIINAVAPAFTRKKAPAGSEEIRLLQQQVAEIQAAVMQNDSSIKTLASQLEHTVIGIERSISIAETTARRRTWLSVAALCCAGVSLVLAAVALWR